MSKRKLNLAKMKDELVDEEETSGTPSLAGSVPESTTSGGNPRASRNMAEKQRRDNLNTNISTMATLVPTVAGSSRRLDKISILRLAAAFLRTQYTLGSGTSSFLPERFSNFHLEQYFIDNLVGNDGFILVVTTAGKIVYISRQIEQQLGHAQCDLFGQSLYNFIFPDDHEELRRNLTPDELSNHCMITDSSMTDDNSCSSEDSGAFRGSQFREQRRSFNLRMSQRSVSRREHPQYECLHINGILRRAVACKNIDERTSKNLELSTTGNDIVFVGTARPMKKRITELSLLEANKEEYVTRHLVDGRIIFCDHRISVVAGYMTDEVSGMSAFAYMHADDVMWTLVALRQMYHRGEAYGSSCYRLKTKTGEYIYLRTHAYIEVDKARQSFESFVCVNTSVSKEEGERLTNEMKARYSATVSNANTLFPCDDIEALDSDSQCMTPSVVMEDPSQLETAISHLISDFVAPPVSEDRSSSSPLPDTQSMKAALISQHLPPPSIQASKIGIKNIDPIPSVSKDKFQTMERGNATKYARNQNNSSSFEDSRQQGKLHSLPSVQTGKNSMSNGRRGDKIVPEINGNGEEQLFHSQEPMANQRYASRGKDYNEIETSSSSNKPYKCETLKSEPSKSTIAQKPSTSTMLMSHRGKPDNMLAYVKTEKQENGHVDATERLSNFTTKRSFVDENVSSSSKKRRGERSLDTNSRVNSKPNADFDSQRNHYDGNKPLGIFDDYMKERITNTSNLPCKMEKIDVSTNSYGIAQRDIDSPCSSVHLQDLPIADYSPLNPLNPANIELSIFDDEPLDDFPDLRVDPLLSPGLDDNPESLDDETMRRFSNSDQALSEGLRRTHQQLDDRMTIQESQLSVLENELEMPAMQSQFFEPSREIVELIEIRAEHKKNVRMLKTIQQDHHNMNLKQNAGV